MKTLKQGILFLFFLSCWQLFAIEEAFFLKQDSHLSQYTQNLKELGKTEWNPNFLPEAQEGVRELLTDGKLVNIEMALLSFLQNSWCSQEKARLLLELVAITKPRVCVEVGTFTGSSALPVLAALSYNGSGKGYMIDAWSAEEAVRGLPANDPNAAWWKNLDMTAIKRHFLHVIRHWSLNSYCRVLSMPSAQAVELIPTIDFLHLDGNFSEEGSLQDSTMYLPKVASGGYILISNVLCMVDGKPSKMKALWPLFEACDIICEIDGGNALLFRKNPQGE